MCRKNLIVDAIQEETGEIGGRGGYFSGHVTMKLNDALSYENHRYNCILKRFIY